MRTENQKYHLTRLFVAIALVAILSPAMAQRILNTPLTASLTVQDGTGIILAPGFSTNGFNFQALIGVPYVDVTPSSDKNYIISTTYNAATTSGVVSQAADLHREIQYFDGLGRPMQSVSVQTSPTGKDIITPIRYDDFGRESTKYLPYAGPNNNGLFVSNDLAGQSSFYTGLINGNDGPKAFAITDYEPSPLNRVLRQGAPGAAWQPDAAIDHTVKLAYGTNTAADNVRMWTVNSDGSPASAIAYPINSLYKTTTWDENNPNDLAITTSRAEEFKDKQGKVVLKRSYNGNVNPAETLSTYYVYDDFDQLRVVIPPLANGDAGDVAALLNDLCYKYTYDAHKRMKEKKLPGVGWTWMVYDKRDRLVATQDPEMRNSGRWLVTKYDQLNRPVMTGLKALGDTRDVLQAYFDTYSSSYYETRDGSGVGYTLSDSFNPKLNLSESDLLTVTYYDNYDFAGKSNFSYNSEIGNNSFSGTKGLVTGTKTKVLETTTFLTSTNYYDDRYRVIQTLRDIYTPDAIYSEVASTLYDFSGKVMQTKQAQIFGGVTTTVDKFYTYDHAGRLSKTEQRIAGDANGKVTVAENSYNEIGQLVDKKLHNNAQQSIDYQYNIRGWLTSINNPDNLANDGTGDTYADLFAERLLYNDNSTLNNLTSKNQYNGNICGIIINHRNDATTATTKSAYGFTYDGLNRLNEAIYAENTGSGFTANLNAYNEFGIKYDLNGNILFLKRNSAGTLVDNLAYTYENTNKSNRLQAVADMSVNAIGFTDVTNNSDYLYDNNGNAKQDLNKGISAISYNVLNLPKTVTKDASNSITYTYTASGEKVMQATKVSGITTNRYYAGLFEYSENNNVKALSMLKMDEGIVTKTSSAYIYEYYLKDHLGNTRITFTPGTIGPDLAQRTDYYPFGLAFSNQYIGSTGNCYLYNGKELQKALGWQVYDYGARFYDAQIGRWHTIDPLTEIYSSTTPYAYVKNNPIKAFDPNGMYELYVDGDLVEGDDKKKAQEQYGLPEDSKKDEKENFINKSEIVDYVYKRIESLIPTRNEIRTNNPRPADEVHIIKETLSNFIMISSDNPNELIYICPDKNNQLIVRRVSKAALDTYLSIGNKEKLLSSAGEATADFGGYIVRVAESKLILRNADLVKIANTQSLGRAFSVFGGVMKVTGTVMNVYGFMSLVLTNGATEPIGEESIKQGTINAFKSFLNK